PVFHCGGHLVTDSGFVGSEGFPSHYKPNRKCTWYITVPEGHVVMLSFRMFDLEADPTCRYDYLDVYNGHSHTVQKLGRFCGTFRPGALISTSNTMMLEMVSDKNQFCGGRLTKAQGSIKTPNWPNSDYPAGISCSWHISVEPSNVIEVKFEKLDIEADTYCRYDYVAFFNGGERDDSRRIGKYCGDRVPGTIVTNGNELLVQFVSDLSVTSNGFMAHYSSVPRGSRTPSSGEDTTHGPRVTATPQKPTSKPAKPARTAPKPKPAIGAKPTPKPATRPGVRIPVKPPPRKPTAKPGVRPIPKPKPTKPIPKAGARPTTQPVTKTKPTPKPSIKAKSKPVKPTKKPFSKPGAKATPKPGAKPVKPTKKPFSKPGAKPTPKPGAKPVKPTKKPFSKPGAKPTPKPGTKPKTTAKPGQSRTKTVTKKLLPMNQLCTLACKRSGTLQSNFCPNDFVITGKVTSLVPGPRGSVTADVSLIKAYKRANYVLMGDVDLQGRGLLTPSSFALLYKAVHAKALANLARQPC
ncbi:unnamed protein product, partial [Coregonus sp. 'balchen']